MKYKVILGSQSPRRKNLLQEIVPHFEVKPIHCEEIFPEELQAKEVAAYLANLKSEAYSGLQKGELLITADTTVCLGSQVINKPENRDHAIEMIQGLSGKCHTVVSGVCIRTLDEKIGFQSETEVYFKLLTTDEITHYVDTFQPYDKAGAYGIQEWIGYIGVEKIVGCYYNVMGLPVSALYTQLKKLKVEF